MNREPDLAAMIVDACEKLTQREEGKPPNSVDHFVGAPAGKLPFEQHGDTNLIYAFGLRLYRNLKK